MKTVLILLTITLLAFKSNCQVKAGHLTFGFIKAEVYDTSVFNLSDIESTVKAFSKRYECEVYFNQRHILVITDDDEVIWKVLYDRKQQIAYSSWERPNGSLALEDSIRGLIIPLSEYISHIDSDKVYVGRIDKRNKRKIIFGFDCFEVTYPSSNGGMTGDGKVYVTEDIIAPSMLFKAGPFREKGLVMEYWAPFVNSTVVVGATQFTKGGVNKKMFKWDLQRFKLIGQ